MTLQLYWWSPPSSPRALAGELANHFGSWATITAHTRRGISNFGDELSPLLLRELTGERVQWSPLRAADIVSVGSVLNAYANAESRAVILGSGIKNPDMIDKAQFSIDRFLSVRGQLSRDFLDLPSGTPIGDPGLAINMIRPARSPLGRASRVSKLLVPHFGVMNSRAGRMQVSAARADGFVIAHPNMHPFAMADVIEKAEFLVTSSLHAYVFANALGVPAQLVSFGSATHEEPNFKYRDYMSVFDLEPRFVAFSSLISTSAGFGPARLASEAENYSISLILPSIVDSIASSYKGIPALLN